MSDERHAVSASYMIHTYIIIFCKLFRNVTAFFELQTPFLYKLHYLILELELIKLRNSSI